MRAAFVLPPTAKIAGSVRPTQWSLNPAVSIGSQWANYAAAARARVSTVSTPLPANHTQVWKMDIVDGDLAYISDDFSAEPVIGGPLGGPYGERTEIGMSNPTTAVSLDKIFNKGDDLWVGWQLRLPSTYPISLGTINWNIISQMKQVGAMGVPAICFKVNNSRLEMWTADTITDTDFDSMKWNSGSILQDQWIKLLLHVNFNTDPAFGFTELWGDMNGSGIVSLDAKTFRSTMKNPDAPNGQTQSHSQLRLGIYRDPAITGSTSAYFGRVGVAQTRSIAEALAFS
jgi:hypothetical protein